ncbi:hypothetical protein CLF_110400 [Clonorchis sinensis]|uniref:Uncharacterized protein n=1 Tax=Clonorchis sinensis TaxID=79923 RepID=G7YTH7_CLOSI|nr:hypothetical protein CLF_110400 [Clonorchis sinensis]
MSGHLSVSRRPCYSEVDPIFRILIMRLVDDFIINPPRHLTRCTFVTPHELLTLDLWNQFGRLFLRVLFDRFTLPRVVHSLLLIFHVQHISPVESDGIDSLECTSDCKPETSFHYPTKRNIKQTSSAITMTDEQRLLGKLLDGYEPASRPTYIASNSVDVRFQMTLIQINQLNCQALAVLQSTGPNKDQNSKLASILENHNSCKEPKSGM